MELKDIVEMKITDKDLYSALEKALNMDFIDNLRHRESFVQLDSKIRGYLGEIAIKKFLEKSPLTIAHSDYYEKGSNEDVDIYINNQNTKNIKVEIKTSLIPDVWKTLQSVVDNADIKIIKREKNYRDIKASFHIQIYFNFYRKKRDEELKRINGKPKDYSKEDLINIMKLNKLKNVFVAWIDKKSLIEYLDTQKNKCWEYGYRQFWHCPLKIAKAPKELITALIDFKGENK